MIPCLTLVDKETKKKVRDLLDAVRQRPSEMPLAELVELSDGKMSITVDREGEEAVVYVSPRPDPRFDALSRREFEVATLVAAGFSNAQIGEALFISVATVKDHVHSILGKTDLASRSEVSAAWYGRI